MQRSNFPAVLMWQMLRMRRWILTLVAFQFVIGIGVALGLGNLLVADDDIGRQFLVSGVAVTVLLSTGIVLTPSLVFRSRENGAMEYLLLQRFPRFYLVISDLVIWSIVAIPGALASVAIASWHFEVTLEPDWRLILLVPLIVLIGVMIGYLIGLSTPSLSGTNIAANALLLLLLLYTPISFPAANLEGWLQDVQSILPFWHAAELFRELTGLGALNEHNSNDSWIVVSSWSLMLLAAPILLLTFPRTKLTNVT